MPCRCARSAERRTAPRSEALKGREERAGTAREASLRRALVRRTQCEGTPPPRSLPRGNEGGGCDGKCAQAFQSRAHFSLIGLLLVKRSPPPRSGRGREAAEYGPEGPGERRGVSNIHHHHFLVRKWLVLDDCGAKQVPEPRGGAQRRKAASSGENKVLSPTSWLSPLRGITARHPRSSQPYGL